MKRLFFLSLLSLNLIGCSYDSNNDSKFNFLDPKGSCKFVESYPQFSKIKIASSSSSNVFNVRISNSDCPITWKLNDKVIGNKELLILSTINLVSGNNILTVETRSSNVTVLKSWTVVINNAPTCGIMSPASTGTSFNYNQQINSSIQFSDADSDPVSVTWKLNNQASDLISSVVLTSSQSSSTLSSRFQNIGLNTLTAQLSDGLDTTDCFWQVTVTDPAGGLTIVSCSPTIIANQISTTVDTVLKSIGIDSSKSLTINVVGNGIRYVWKKNGSIISGQTSPQLNISSSSLSSGEYVYRVDVLDYYNNGGFCEWKVKRNSSPIISSSFPLTDPYFTNYLNSTMLSVSTSDSDSDTLQYSWTIDGLVSPSHLSNGLTSALFTPDVLILGQKVLKVEVSDGYESVSKQWTININGFLDSCNILYADQTSASNGKICTLSGNPSLGVGEVQLDNVSLQKLRPTFLVEDKAAGYNGVFIASETPYGVYYWNLGNENVVRNGINIGAGKLEIIAGQFAIGSPIDTGDTTQNGFKIGLVGGLVFDKEDGSLYISDATYHKVYKITATGSVSRFFGLGAVANNSSTNTNFQVGTEALCLTPKGMAIKTIGGNKHLYVACSGSHTIKRIGIDSTNSFFNKTEIVVGNLTGGVSSSGISEGTLGYLGTAKISAPQDLEIDDLDNLYWTDSGIQFKLRVANLSSITNYFLNNTVYLGSNQTTTLIGTSTNSLNISTESRIISSTLATLRNPRGLSLLKDTSNNVKGIFISTSPSHLFLNNSDAPISFGTTTVGINELGFILGGASFGFIDGAAQNTWFSYSDKTVVSHDNSSLYILDYHNGRIRKLDFSSGMVSTIYGSGIGRMGLTLDLAIPSTKNQMDFPYHMNINREENMLYYTDQSNGRIKKINLKTGFVETVVGIGNGTGAAQDNQDAQSTTLGYPRGIIQVQGVGTKLLVWTEVWKNKESLTTNLIGVTYPCVVRAYNPSQNYETFLGTKINPNSISVIAGDFHQGCGNLIGTGGLAKSARLPNPESILYHNGNLYIVHTTAHCITKVDINGFISVFAGTCGTIAAAGMPADAGGVADPLFRFPSYIINDPQYPGNFIVSDQYDSIGAIRYINTLQQSVSFRGVTIPAANVGGIRVKTILTEASNSGRINGITAFFSGSNYWLCFSTGQISVGQVGSHNVACYDRTGLNSYIINSSTTKGKSPQSFDQEGSLGINAFLYTPTGIDFDSNGNLYIIERNGALIRMVKKWF